jgi:hypothetical protein
MKLTLKSIKSFPGHLRLFTTNEEILILDYDGQQGLFTKNEWIDDETLMQFDEDSQAVIINYLENTSNNFFYEPKN